MVLYFSGTGNTEYVAKRIAEGIGDKAINLTKKLQEKDYSELTSETPWVIASPTYAWQIPRMVKKWLIKTPLAGCPDIYYVMTCAGSIGDAAGYAKAIAEHKSLNYKGLSAVIMPENFYTAMESPSADKALEIIANSEEKISSLIYYIKQGEDFPAEKKGSFKSLKSNGINKLFYRMMHKTYSDSKFHTSENCTGCGNCVRICPMSNITLGDDDHPVWHGNCTQCLACISKCPFGAIDFGKKTIGKEKYLCPKHLD